MATAGTASIIACWPVEGCSWDDALKRTPAWDSYVNRAPLQVKDRPLSDDPTPFDADHFIARDKSERFVRQQIEKGLLIIVGSDARDDQRRQIEPSLVRHLKFYEGLMRGLGRTFYDVRVFAAPAIKAPAAIALDPFRTGAPGKPTAAGFIRGEMERRIGAGEVAPRLGGLEACSRVMFDWYEDERVKFDPAGPKVKSPGSVKNMIRTVWNGALKGARN